jgi:hypothetical protein
LFFDAAFFLVNLKLDAPIETLAEVGGNLECACITDEPD